MPMRVKVKIFADHDRSFRWIRLADNASTLRTLLNILSRGREKDFLQQGCITVINGDVIVGDKELFEGDEIEVLPMIQGG